MNEWIDMAAGVQRRTLVSGDTMMQMLVTLAGGSRLPEHQHPQEQISHVLMGRLRFTLGRNAEDGGANVRELGPGDSLYLPANVPHAAEALDDCTVLDTFSPPREDLLAQDRQHTATRN